MTDVSAYNQQDISSWLKNKVATISQLDIEQVKEDVPFSEYSLDSLHAVNLTGDLEDLLNMSIDPTVVWDYPTIRELSGFLCQELATMSTIQ